MPNRDQSSSKVLMATTYYSIQSSGTLVDLQSVCVNEITQTESIDYGFIWVICFPWLSYKCVTLRVEPLCVCMWEREREKKKE